MRMRAISAGLAAGLLTSALACCGNDAMRQRRLQRDQNLARAARWVSQLEADRQERLAYLNTLMARQYERDLANTRQNPARAQARLRRDVQRWHERLPEHRQRFDEQMRGDPANIERTVPRLID